MAKKKSSFPFSSKGKMKRKQPKVAKVEKGQTNLAPYGIGADMKQSINY